MPVLLKPEYPPTDEPCPRIDDPESIREGYDAYLKDESRIETSIPDVVYFPETTAHVVAAVREIAANGGTLTVSGARTGIVGGAVAQPGALIVTERIKSPIDPFETDAGDPAIRCGAGVTLEEIRDMLADSDRRYPVDPTEMSASVGGTVSTNASGARTLKYGPTRAWVKELVVVLADGGVLRLARGTHVSEDGAFEIIGATGETKGFRVESVRIPSTKHNAGYYLTTPCDAIDLFVGSEGTLGIVTEAVLGLTDASAAKIGMTFFLRNDAPEEAVQVLLSFGPTALEYMDSNSIRLLSDAREAGIDGGAVPPLPEGTSAALYFEIDLDSEDELDPLYERLEEQLAPIGVDLESTWAGFDEREIAGMKRFRHALPERINALVAERKRTVPELSKIGTDMAVPVKDLGAMLEIYRTRLSDARLDFYAFGHIGNGHLHVNVIPKDMDEWNRGYALYKEFASKTVELGGSVAGEHGIGRLKRPFLSIQFCPEEIDSMKRIKRALDPTGLLNRGVVFGED